MYDAFEDPYAYPETSVLRNRLDIRNAQALETLELEVAAIRAEEPLPTGNFDADHYCRIHDHLFGEVYDWAGQYRTVRTSKGGNAFCYPEYIPDAMTALCERFQYGQRFANCTLDEFARLLAEFLGELNSIHPFREGNGRAQLAFLGLIGETFGHSLHFERLQRDPFLRAMIDSFLGRLDPLIVELTRLLE